MESFPFQQFEGHYFPFSKHFDTLTVEGPDAERFLNGQLTNDVTHLNKGHFHLQARLDRTGKLLTYFYLLKSTEGFFILTPKIATADLKADLEKFIIMDDVSISSSETQFDQLISFYQNPEDEYGIKKAFKGRWGNMPALFIPNGGFDRDKELSDIEWERLALLRGEPVWNKTAKQNQLVTDTVVNLTGVSLEKGCFLGQETVSKIETRRGGAYLPVALLVENPERNISLKKDESLKHSDRKIGKIIENVQFSKGSYLIVSLLRDYRVQGKTFDLQTEQGESFRATVNYLPLGGEFNKKEYSEKLYEEAVETFQNENEDKAIEKFEEVLKVDPLNEDSFEAIGVIFGRMEKYQEGISFMDKVLEANPDSVMAHTNKSLFYMRIGKIEEAEEEKAQATVKSFAVHGQEAAKKKKAEEDKLKEEQELERRLEMFRQVLELDPEDDLANFGMADIFFKRGQYEEALPLLEKVIKNNPKYSVGYLLLGKVHLESKNFDSAKDILEKGIEVASKQGDLMPANEMQQKLSQIP